MSKCPYQTAEHNTNADVTQLTSRQAATILSISKSSINKHRAGACACGKPSPPAGSTGVLEAGSQAGVESYTTMSETPWGLAEWRVFLRAKGQDPDLVTFKWGITSNPHGGFWNKLNDVRPVVDVDVVELVDLPALYAAARTVTPAVRSARQDRATVVVWTDPQIGKVARRGGTPELLERSVRVRALLRDLLAERQPSSVTLLDGGDGFENFNSGGNPMFTNDLSLAGQMDLYGTELFEFINTCHAYAPLTVAGVPSNHTAWRLGKQLLGNPQDDLGLFMHHQVQKVTEASHMAVTWVEPSPYDETTTVDVMGTTIGLVHGNQFGPGQAVQWWEKQTFGAQAVARADVLIHGHYHSFSANVAGRNPVNQRQRWCFGAPTLDNGSDWYRTTAGRDSDPGLMVFDITPNGFDLASLTILS